MFKGLLLDVMCAYMSWIEDFENSTFLAKNIFSVIVSAALCLYNQGRNNRSKVVTGMFNTSLRQVEW